MGSNEDLRILLVKEKMTITELAQLATEKSGKNYTVYGISQKLVRGSMKYDELKFLAEVLGYKINFEKISG
ncbi:LLM class flavin-dependent oxidoreductase [bacterium]|nr:LLM class flavin-dependent oxidoreductase [bacterium]